MYSSKCYIFRSVPQSWIFHIFSLFIIFFSWYRNGNDDVLGARSLKLLDSIKAKSDVLKKDVQQEKDIKGKKEGLRDKIKAIKQQIKSENEKEKKEEGTVRWE